MTQPLVSVVMPVYNGAAYIKKAVDSVYIQDVPLELLVIDDCSTDNTKEILDSCGDKSGFRYFRNNRNLGAAGSRNLGVREAKGEYIAFLDADDWWAEGKTERTAGASPADGKRALFHRKRTDES